MKLTRLFSMSILTMFFLVLFSALPAFAQAVANPDIDFLSQVMQFINQYGGLSSMAKISGICLLIIALTKTSFISPLWAKLPQIVQTLIAPFLGLVAGLITQGSGLTWASAFAFISAGAGAVFLHEILDGVKAIPGIGPIYVTIIDLIEGALGGSKLKVLP